MAKRGKRKDVQKAILAMVALYGSTATTSCCAPFVCDPAPPPTTTERPTPTGTPMICDPAPPPSVVADMPSPTPMVCDPPPPPATSTPDVTPMICDPPPPPTEAPAATTAVVERTFRLRGLQVTAAETQGIVIRGQVTAAHGQSAGGLRVVARGGRYDLQVLTMPDGSFQLPIPEAGPCHLSLSAAEGSAITLQLEAHAQVMVEWTEVQPEARLPLAQIRHVDIVPINGLHFTAQSPWTGGQFRWSATGGELVETETGVRWQPPTDPGRYLIQVVADWGADGLAVDALVVTVETDGSVHI